MEFAGRYRLRRRIAAGGMGEVWEATAKGEGGFSRRVAVKRLSSASPRSQSEARMFLDEARIASQLHHANIVSILDFGVEDGAPFQVLEYVEGIDAAELERLAREKGRPLPAALALHICVEVAHALHYAHSATDAAGNRLRIVHRDVTPHNILVSWSGDVKLTDFGIALAEGRLERTVAGVAKGKPAYMSPEQSVAASLDHRTDVFALGCVLHALLTGQTPLAGENRLVDLLAGIELPVEASLEADVKAIIQRAVQRERHARFETADSFARACGLALHARLGQDPRSVLREFLEALRPFATAPSSEDPRAAPEDGGASTDDSQITRAARPNAKSAGTVTSTRIDLARPARAKRSLLASGAVAVAVAAVAAAVAASVSGADPPARAQLAPPEPVPSAPAVIASAQPEPQPAPPEPTAPATGRKRTSKGAPDVSAGPAHRAPRPPSAGQALATGTVAIGGPGAHQSEIFVSGKSYGFAPKLVELPVGEHEVALVTRSGERQHKKLSVSIRNTAAKPLRWLVDEAPGPAAPAP